MAARMSLKQLTEPLAEPLALDDARAHLKLDAGDSDDELLLACIKTARTTCENFTGRALIQRNYSLFLDSWPEGTGPENGSGNLPFHPLELELPRPPLAQVIKINIYDNAGVPSLFPAASYYVDSVGEPGRIILQDAASVPNPGRRVNGVEIQYTAGYGLHPAAIPAPLAQGIRLLTAALYENRGDDGMAVLTECGATAFFAPFRIMRIG